jgi:hypothetical protein
MFEFNIHLTKLLNFNSQANIPHKLKHIILELNPNN